MTRSLSTKKQQGDFLVEAVIGLVLVSVLIQGVLFVTSRTSAVRSTQRLQEMAVQQMRAALMQNLSGTIDICSTAPIINLPNSVTITAQVQGCNTTTTAQINGATVTGVPRPIALSVTSDLLGGQVVVGGTWTST